MPIYLNTGNRKYFAYSNEPQNLTIELTKLNGMQFTPKCMILEYARNKPTAFSEANLNRPRSLIVSNHLTDENYQSKLPVRPVKKR